MLQHEHNEDESKKQIIRSTKAGDPVNLILVEIQFACFKERTESYKKRRTNKRLICARKYPL